MKYKSLISGLALFFLQVAVFYYAFCFLFPFKEQVQMFQFTSQYADATLRQAGGLALYISEFLVQFYVVIGVGPILSALLLTAVAVLLFLIIKKINKHHYLPFLCLLPWISLLIMHLDYDYLEQGTISYLFLLLCLWGYTILKPQMRFLYGICMIPILYGIAGPVAHLFAVSALLFEFLTDGKKKYICVVYLPVAALVAVAGNYWGYSRDLTSAFLPDAYYDPMLHDPKIYYSWYALPIAMLLAAYLNRYKPAASPKKQYWIQAIQCAGILFLTYQSILHLGRLDTSESVKQDYYIRTSQWDQVISEFDDTALSKRRMCGLNLALAYKGQLSDRLFDYPQRGIETLMIHWDQSVYTAGLHSDLYYCMGVVSASQKCAFEAFVSSHPSGNPRMLKRLIDTNLITGAYPVAAKYIRILENTWYYKDWATSRRRFLYNDEAVDQDKELGLKRRCWEVEKGVSKVYTDPVSALVHLIPGCPDNRAGLQYLTSFLLLNKDIQTYKAVQEKWYRTPAWPEMTVSQQEAVIVGTPNDPRYWLEHGVSIKVRNRSMAFMNKVQANAQRSDLMSLLAGEYGKSYWYYYMFYKE